MKIWKGPRMISFTEEGKVCMYLVFESFLFVFKNYINWVETTYVSSFFNFVGKIITRLIKRIMKRLGSFNWINFIHRRESIAKSDLSLKNSKLIGRKMNSYFSVPGLGWYRGSVGSRRLVEKVECAWIILLLASLYFLWPPHFMFIGLHSFICPWSWIVGIGINTIICISDNTLPITKNHNRHRPCFITWLKKQQ